MSFSIITPSLNMLSFLKRCCASVADQDSVVFEHIVMDGGSTDGSVDWLRSQTKVKAFIQADKGMYDAINHGISIANGDIVAYLNCDEQYLPGTLNYVQSYFSSHPDIDIVFGDALLVDTDGKLLAYRKGYQPRWFYIAVSHLYVLSCAMFLRRRVFNEGLIFNNNYRSIGDLDFIVRVLRKQYRVTHVNRYMAVFTVTGNNLSASSITAKEWIQFYSNVPSWLKVLRWPVNLLRLIEKAISGAYSQKFPLEYPIYSSDLNHRTTHTATSSTYKWPLGTR